MSDFLSKFNKDNYDELLDEQGEKKEVKQEKQREPEDKQEEVVEKKREAAEEPKAASASPTPPPTPTYQRRDTEEEFEIDPEYRKKKQRQLIYIIGGAILACLLIFIIYYQAVHVKVEDFVGAPVSEARAWAQENDVEIELVQEHSMEQASNHILAQSVAAGDKIRKGKTLELTSSLGPDPEEVIPLPDFSILSQAEAADWKEVQQAENLQMVMEYSDDVPEGEFIKLSIRDSSVDEADYQRKDSAAVYYSRGKEVFEKNIPIPDFVGKPVEEVETWVTTNEIDMTYTEKDSDTVEAGFIMTQSLPAEDRIAKRDEMEVVVSVGKATVVPDFSELTAEQAASNYPDLDIRVKQIYHADVGYGRLISQSVEAGKKFTGENAEPITVTYSLGKPYLGDFRGLLEGELPRVFFDEYQSKGADIKYIVKYEWAPEIKGTVVGMSKFNEFVPLKYTVEIRVSNNVNALVEGPPMMEEEPEFPIEGEIIPDDTRK